MLCRTRSYRSKSGDDTGGADIGGIDTGTSSYLRQYFQLQELPTDEAVVAWNDAFLPDLHNMNWGSTNSFITALYYRIFYQVALCNEFIRETTDENWHPEILPERRLKKRDYTEMKRVFLEL